MRSIELPETEDERRYRHAACLLADIGWRAHPDYRGEQSLNILAQAAFVGLDHPGRAYMALSIFFRHDGLSVDRVSPRLRALAGPRLLERARLLAALMRVAYPLSVAMEGVLPRTPLVARGPHVVLRLPKDLAGLANERLTGRMKQISKLSNLEARIEIA
jgi:exopolyphosphatase/guanosine-5'-triphosphate,3'-diphosphate pyrophosphatase